MPDPSQNRDPFVSPYVDARGEPEDVVEVKAEPIRVEKMRLLRNIKTGELAYRPLPIEAPEPMDPEGEAQPRPITPGPEMAAEEARPAAPGSTEPRAIGDFGDNPEFDAWMLRNEALGEEVSPLEREIAEDRGSFRAVPYAEDSIQDDIPRLWKEIPDRWESPITQAARVNMKNRRWAIADDGEHTFARIPEDITGKRYYRNHIEFTLKQEAGFNDSVDNETGVSNDRGGLTHRGITIRFHEAAWGLTKNDDGTFTDGRGRNWDDSYSKDPNDRSLSREIGFKIRKKMREAGWTGWNQTPEQELQLDKWLRAEGLRLPTLVDVHTIYETQYWAAHSLDAVEKLDSGLAGILFDANVNTGDHGRRALQKLLGTAVDGKFWDDSFDALFMLADANGLPAIKALKPALLEARFQKHLADRATGKEDMQTEHWYQRLDELAAKYAPEAGMSSFVARFTSIKAGNGDPIDR